MPHWCLSFIRIRKALVMKIVMGCDHAGLNLKEEVKKHLADQGHEIDDKGVHTPESTDYPDWAAQVAKAVAAGEADFGVLVCGSGIGMSITANRFKGVRAVLAPTMEHAKLGRQHNNGNVLCMGERLTPWTRPWPSPIPSCPPNSRAGATSAGSKR